MVMVVKCLSALRNANCVGEGVISLLPGTLHLPTTMRENWKPLFTAFLNTWLGRLAKPTKEADAFS